MITAAGIKEVIKTRLLSNTITVKISQCVHFCGFRYGLKEYNPYETYITELHERKDENLIKEKFVRFLQYYRPSTFGEALGISLSRAYPLWQYPWAKRINLEYNAHDMDHDIIPDIITHFSSVGIPYRIIENEFIALQKAYESIRSIGYQPQKYGYAEVLCLRSGNANAYILLDGNHRVSALSALGHEEVIVKLYYKNIICREKHNHWEGVKKGIYTADDALKVFDAYFTGNRNYKISHVAAPIIY